MGLYRRDITNSAEIGNYVTQKELVTGGGVLSFVTTETKPALRSFGTRCNSQRTHFAPVGYLL